MLSLKDKVAVVTGGGKGIGRATCLAFAERGATVCILEIDMESAADVQTTIGSRCHVYECDVGEAEHVVTTMDRIADAHGGIDILVNNAGVADIGKIEDTTDAIMDRIYRINVKGVFYGMRAAIPHMRARGGGSIINLASIVSTLGIPDRFAYTTSKGAVAAMTRSVAVDYLSDGIRCNCVMPARIHTPFVDGYLDTYYADTKDAMFAKLSAAQPIGRMGQPDEVAALICYLAADESAFTTGAAIPIGGGVFTLRP